MSKLTTSKLIEFKSRAQFLIISFPIIFLVFACYQFNFNTSIYYRLFGVSETGFFEWVQFVVYLVAAVVGFFSYKALRGNSAFQKQRILMLLFTIGLFLIAFEEVSWGQHIFKWESPEVFQEINRQKETNVHNMRPVQRKLHNTFILVGLYGGLAWRFKNRKNNLDVKDFIFPDKLIALYFLPTAVFYFHFKFLNRLKLYVIGNHQEVVETLLSLGFLLLAISNLAKAKSLAAQKLDLARELN